MRRNKLTAALVGIGATAALLLPATGAFADSGRNRPAAPRVRVEVRHQNDRPARRDSRRDAYRKGYEAGRREARRDSHHQVQRHHRYDRVAFRR